MNWKVQYIKERKEYYKDGWKVTILGVVILLAQLALIFFAIRGCIK